MHAILNHSEALPLMTLTHKSSDCRLEAEQEASKKAYHKFHSDSVISTIRTKNYNNEENLSMELKALIAAAESGKKACLKDDRERAQKLLLVRSKLDTAMNGVFSAFDEVLRLRTPTERVSEMDVAVALCRECSRKLQNDKRRYGVLLRQIRVNTVTGPNDAGPTPTRPMFIPGTAAYSGMLVVRNDLKRSIDATETTYRELENALLVDHAAPLLGERAKLVQPMSEENLAKLSRSLQAQPTANSPANSLAMSLARRSQRNSDGRPAGHITETIPPAAPRLAALAEAVREHQTAAYAIRNRTLGVQRKFQMAFANGTVVFPAENADAVRSRIHGATLGLPPSATYEEIERDSYAQMVALGTQLSEAGDDIHNVYGPSDTVSAETWRRQVMDGNIGSENVEFRAEQLRSMMPVTIRRWNANTVRRQNSSIDLNELAGSIPSSDQAMRPPSTSGEWDDPFLSPIDEKFVRRKVQRREPLEATPEARRAQSLQTRATISRDIAGRGYSAQDKAWVAAASSDQ